MRRCWLFAVAMTVCLSGQPAAAAGSILSSDLGSGSSAYSTATYNPVSGAYLGNPIGQSKAMLFTVAGSGSQAVSQIDLGVSEDNSSISFAVSIWTDNAGVPGMQVANAAWTASTSTPPFTCCPLVSIKNIAGVTLSGGTQYFLVLSPLSPASSFVFWYTNNQGVTGLGLGSLDGGATWSGGVGVPSAFDILGGPQTSTVAAYSYTGNAFTSIEESGNTAVTGTFTVSAPLGDNLVSQGIIPLTYTFSDGVNVKTNTNSNPILFVVWTNASGAITNWLVASRGPGNIGTENGAGDVDDFGGPTGGSFIPNDPGTWSQSTVSTVTGPGGTSSTPVLLTAPFVGEVTGTIGGIGSQDYYGFYWGGGAFSATVSIPGANAGASYLLSEGAFAGGCSGGGTATLNSSDSFTGTIAIANLAPGYYCAGIDANSSNDPAFALTFNTPVTGSPAFFAGQVSLGGGVEYLQFPNSTFGYYTFVAGTIFYHYDMGYEAFVPGSAADLYLYDFTTGHWWYTSNTLFPYLYDFTLKTWIYYFPNTQSPGHYTTNPRYFSNLTTGQIFVM